MKKTPKVPAKKSDRSDSSPDEPREHLKPTLYLVGSRDGLLSFEDILALSRKLMGREPTEEEIAEAKAKWEKELH